MQGLKTGDLKRAPEEKFYRTTKTDGSHEAPGGVEHADKVTKPQEISSAQAERPIGASSGEILESKGREPKGATNINMEAKKAAEEREEHRGIGLGYHTRYTKRVNSHEAPDKKTSEDSDTKWFHTLWAWKGPPSKGCQETRALHKKQDSITHH